MSRERMVTRTVTVNTYKVMYCDITTGTTGITDFNFYGNQYDKETALKVIKKSNKNPNSVPVAIVDCVSTEKLYGMPEVQFVALAEEMPLRASGNDNE